MPLKASLNGAFFAVVRRKTVWKLRVCDSGTPIAIGDGPETNGGRETSLGVACTDIQRRAKMVSFELNIGKDRAVPVLGARFIHPIVTCCMQWYSKWTSSVISLLSYLTVVSCVSLYDIHLTILYAKYLKCLEENPVGRWLMDLDDVAYNQSPDLTMFLLMKVLGTLVVLGAIVRLIRWRSELGHPVAMGVSLFQLVLAGYLTF